MRPQRRHRTDKRKNRSGHQHQAGAGAKEDGGRREEKKKLEEERPSKRREARRQQGPTRTRKRSAPLRRALLPSEKDETTTTTTPTIEEGLRRKRSRGVERRRKRTEEADKAIPLDGARNVPDLHNDPSAPLTAATTANSGWRNDDGHDPATHVPKQQHDDDDDGRTPPTPPSLPRRSTRSSNKKGLLLVDGTASKRVLPTRNKRGATTTGAAAIRSEPLHRSPHSGGHHRESDTKSSDTTVGGCRESSSSSSRLTGAVGRRRGPPRTNRSRLRTNSAEDEVAATDENLVAGGKAAEYEEEVETDNNGNDGGEGASGKSKDGGVDYSSSANGTKHDDDDDRSATSRMKGTAVLPAAGICSRRRGTWGQQDVVSVGDTSETPKRGARPENTDDVKQVDSRLAGCGEEKKEEGEHAADASSKSQTMGRRRSMRRHLPGQVPTSRVAVIVAEDTTTTTTTTTLVTKTKLNDIDGGGEAEAKTDTSTTDGAGGDGRYDDEDKKSEVPRRGKNKALRLHQRKEVPPRRTRGRRNVAETTGAERKVDGVHQHWVSREEGDRSSKDGIAERGGGRGGDGDMMQVEGTTNGESLGSDGGISNKKKKSWVPRHDLIQGSGMNCGRRDETMEEEGRRRGASSLEKAGPSPARRHTRRRQRGGARKHGDGPSDVAYPNATQRFRNGGQSESASEISRGEASNKGVSARRSADDPNKDGSNDRNTKRRRTENGQKSNPQEVCATGEGGGSLVRKVGNNLPGQRQVGGKEHAEDQSWSTEDADTTSSSYEGGEVQESEGQDDGAARLALLSRAAEEMEKVLRTETEEERDTPLTVKKKERLRLCLAMFEQCRRLHIETGGTGPVIAPKGFGMEHLPFVVVASRRIEVESSPPDGTTATEGDVNPVQNTNDPSSDAADDENPEELFQSPLPSQLPILLPSDVLPPPPTPSPHSSSSGRYKNRGKYKCGLCGHPNKSRHACTAIGLMHRTTEIATQTVHVDPTDNVARILTGNDRFIVVSPPQSDVELSGANSEDPTTIERTKRCQQGVQVGAQMQAGFSKPELGDADGRLLSSLLTLRSRN